MDICAGITSDGCAQHTDAVLVARRQGSDLSRAANCHSSLTCLLCASHYRLFVSVGKCAVGSE